MIKLAGIVAGILAAIGVVGLLSGCSGGPSSESGMMITPGSAALAPGETIKFQVVGTKKKVTWSVNGVAGGNPTVGTIDTNGNYTAPSANNGANLAITATTRSGLSASAQVIVVPPGIVTATANPQVALYTISPPVDAMVTIAFGQTTNYGFTTWTQSTPTGGGAVGTFVAGMLANTTYHMQATAKFSNGVTFTDVDHTFTTTALPADKLPSLTVTTTPGMMPQSGVELLDLVVVGPATNHLSLFATDLNGSVLWSYDPGSSVPSTDVANPIKLLSNGHFLINFSGALADGSNSVLQEVDLSGQVIWQMTAAQLNQALAAATCTGCNITVTGTHHDFAALPNGHLVVIAATQQVVSGTTVTGDVLIDLDQNHKPVWLWNEFDHLDINRRPYLYPDWTHTNAIL
jgi:arylsulfate sulfotransferase